MTRGWMEEAGENEFMAYENLKLSLGRKNNDLYKIPKKLLLTCNPKKNFLYRDFYKPFKAGNLAPNKRFIQSLVTDNTFRQSGAIETLDAIRDEVAKQRLRYGNWDYDNNPAKLIDYLKLIDLFDNKAVAGGNKYMTIDVARKGRDKSVIIIWDGWKVIDIVSLSRNKITELATLCNALRGKYAINRTNVCADEDGVGGGLVDILDCIGFVNNSKPVEIAGTKENFDNLRSQCIYKFSQKVNDNAVTIHTTDIKVKETIIEELDAVKLKSVDDDGKISIISREEFIKLIGRSPDYLSALMQRIYIDIAKKNIIHGYKIISKS